MNISISIENNYIIKDYNYYNVSLDTNFKETINRDQGKMGIKDQKSKWFKIIVSAQNDKKGIKCNSIDWEINPKYKFSFSLAQK